MPATAITLTGSLTNLIQSNGDYEPIGITAVASEYTERIAATISGSTYWGDIVSSNGQLPAEGRPISMLRTPGFAVKEPEDIRRTTFRQIEDPDDIAW